MPIINDEYRAQLAREATERHPLMVTVREAERLLTLTERYLTEVEKQLDPAAKRTRRSPHISDLRQAHAHYSEIRRQLHTFLWPES